MGICKYPAVHHLRGEIHWSISPILAKVGPSRSPPLGTMLPRDIYLWAHPPVPSGPPCLQGLHALPCPWLLLRSLSPCSLLPCLPPLPSSSLAFLPCLPPLPSSLAFMPSHFPLLATSAYPIIPSNPLGRLPQKALGGCG